MSAHIEILLGEVCTVNPRTARTGHSGEETAVSFVPMAAVDERFGTIAVREERPLAEVSKGFTAFMDGDVLFAKITPCMENGKAALAQNLTNGVGRGSTEFYVLRPGDRVLSEYIYHFVRQPEFREAAKRSFIGTAGQQRVPKSFMENALLPIPPLDEQRRIVDVLNRAARIELLRAEAAERLREFNPALFIKMFGDPVENPMGWDVEHLGELIVRGPQNGLYKPRSDYGSGTPILRIDGFYNGHIIDVQTWQRLRLDGDTMRKFALAEDDIVVNRVNSRPFLGKSAIVLALNEPAVFESNMMRLAVDARRILPKLLISMLQIDTTRHRLRRNAKDAINQSSINQADVCELPVIVPPLMLQDRFVKVVSMARTTADVAEFASRTAESLPTSLMARLLGGGR